MNFAVCHLQHNATKDLYALSKEFSVPADTLMNWVCSQSTDLSQQFRDWIIAELRKHAEHEQRAQAAQAAPAQVRADRDAYQPQQQQPEPSQPAAPAAGSAPLSSNASFGSRQPGGGGMGGTLEALRARMNQLQSKGPQGPTPAHGSAPGALTGTNNSGEFPGMMKAPAAVVAAMEATNALSDGGIAVGPAEPTAAAGPGQRSLDDMKRRLQSMRSDSSAQ